MRSRIDVTGQRGRRTSPVNHPGAGQRRRARWCHAWRVKGRYLTGKPGHLYFGGALASTQPRHRRGTMSEPAPRSAILASHSVTGQAEVDRFNAILEAAGLGRPLGPPKQYTRTLAVLPVSADADLRAVVAKLREAAPEGSRQSSSYRIHTVSDDPTSAQILLTETNLLDAARSQLRANRVKSGQRTVTSKPPTTEF